MLDIYMEGAKQWRSRLSTHIQTTIATMSLYQRLKKNLSLLKGIRIFNLYKDDPVLRFDAMYRRRDLAHDIDMKVYRDLLIWTVHLIFIFLTWRSGMPAILKGYIERVFVAGFAYDNTVRGLKGRLGDTVRIITTHNTPKIFSFCARPH